MTYDEQKLLEQKEMAENLCRSQWCPHCRAPLTPLDIISLAQGDGFIKHVLVQVPGGTQSVMRYGDVNPQTMLIVEK